jgi:hypothetical protein
MILKLEKVTYKQIVHLDSKKHDRVDCVDKKNDSVLKTVNGKCGDNVKTKENVHLAWRKFEVVKKKERKAVRVMKCANGPHIRIVSYVKMEPQKSAIRVLKPIEELEFV